MGLVYLPTKNWVLCEGYLYTVGIIYAYAMHMFHIWGKESEVWFLFPPQKNQLDVGETAVAPAIIETHHSDSWGH